VKLQARHVLAALVLCPLGAALADYAEQAAPAPADLPAEVRELLAVGTKIASNIASAREQLENAAQAARKDDDQLLAACLLDHLDAVTKLEKKVGPQLEALKQAPDASAAQQPFVVLTVLAQRITLAMQEASVCVDSDDEASATLDQIAPPIDPGETDISADTELDPTALPPIDTLPPAPQMESETDVSADTELPIDMPEPPPVASPVR
jgi:hypothetical protein